MASPSELGNGHNKKSGKREKFISITSPSDNLPVIFEEDSKPLYRAKKAASAQFKNAGQKRYNNRKYKSWKSSNWCYNRYRRKNFEENTKFQKTHHKLVTRKLHPEPKSNLKAHVSDALGSTLRSFRQSTNLRDNPNGYYPNAVDASKKRNSFESTPSLVFSPSSPYYQTTKSLQPMRFVREEQHQHFSLYCEASLFNANKFSKNVALGGLSEGIRAESEYQNDSNAEHLNSIDQLNSPENNDIEEVKSTNTVHEDQENGGILHQYKPAQSSEEKRAEISLQVPSTNQNSGKRFELFMKKYPNLFKTSKPLAQIPKSDQTLSSEVNQADKEFGCLDQENAQMDNLHHRTDIVPFDHALDKEHTYFQSSQQTLAPAIEEKLSKKWYQADNSDSDDIRSIKAKISQHIANLQNEITSEDLIPLDDRAINDHLIQMETQYNVNSRYFTSDSEGCKRCKYLDHTKQFCPEHPNKICLFCLDIHDISDCLQIVCFRCHTLGHKAADCRLYSKPSCSRCNKKGHKAEKCNVIIPPRTFVPNAKDDFKKIKSSKASILCLKCGKVGHTNCNPIILNDNLFPVNEL